MEILFENSYIRNIELAKEVFRFYYFQREGMVICYALLLLSFVVNLFTLIFEKTYYWSIFVIAPLYFLFNYIVYIHQVRVMVKRDCEVYGKEISV